MCLSWDEDQLCGISVPRPRPWSTQDSLSEAKRIRPPCAFRLFNRVTGALQFVPPPPIEPNARALVMMESRGFNARLTISLSNGRTSEDGFLRRIAAWPYRAQVGQVAKKVPQVRL